MLGAYSSAWSAHGSGPAAIVFDSSTRSDILRVIRRHSSTRQPAAERSLPDHLDRTLPSIHEGRVQCLTFPYDARIAGRATTSPSRKCLSRSRSSVPVAMPLWAGGANWSRRARLPARSTASKSVLNDRRCRTPTTAMSTAGLRGSAHLPVTVRVSALPGSKREQGMSL